VHTGVVEIPPGLIKKRWTVAAREGAQICITGYKEAAALNTDAAIMYGLLHASAMELVCMGTASRQAFEIAVDYVSHAKAAISAMVVDDPGVTELAAQTIQAKRAKVLEFDPTVAAPPRVRSRGRPKELRFKSPIESPGCRKRSSTSKQKTQVSTEERPRRSARFLKTGVYLVEHCGTCDSTQHPTSECPINVDAEQTEATKRRCKSCGEVGHNRSTCGRKLTYVPK
jgi:hypothetical protein